MKNFRKMCRGEKGFTLIELLVVIIILGVLAAVVTLAVTRFIGKGVLESANAELVTVQAATESALAEASSGTLLNIGSAWSGGTAAAKGPYAQGTSENVTIYDQMRTHKLKAAYTFNAAGDVILGDATIAGGWGPVTKIKWDATDMKWVKGP